MSYPRGLPPPFEPEPYKEPMTADRFMEVLWSFVADQSPKNVEALRDCLRELFRRLAT